MAAIHRSRKDFGCEITLISPAGQEAELVGLSSDVHAAIDPSTGQVVSGRKVHVSLVLADIAAAGLEQPKNVAAKNAKPWLVRFNDLRGTQHTFKVAESLPDRALGNIILLLEHYVT